MISPTISKLSIRISSSPVVMALAQGRRKGNFRTIFTGCEKTIRSPKQQQDAAAATTTTPATGSVPSSTSLSLYDLSKIQRQQQLPLLYSSCSRNFSTAAAAADPAEQEEDTVKRRTRRKLEKKDPIILVRNKIKQINNFHLS
jgi:hypothetical protein